MVEWDDHIASTIHDIIFELLRERDTESTTIGMLKSEVEQAMSLPGGYLYTFHDEFTGVATSAILKIIQYRESR